MTLQDLIISALRMGNVLGSGESPSSDELADALIVSSMIIDNWNGEPGAQTDQRQRTVTLNGAASYTLANRPIRITGARATDSGGVQKPVKVAADAAEFGQLVDQPASTQHWPQAIHCDYAFPTSTIYVGPLSSGTLTLTTIEPLYTAYTAVSDTVTLSPGMLNLLRLELAVRLAPEYGRPVPQSVADLYSQAKAAIGSRNAANRSGSPMAAPEAA